MRQDFVAKRVFDLVFTIPGIVVLSPVFCIVALCVKLSDGGPVFYRQKRVGIQGKEFLMLKFRSMYVDADKRGTLVTIGKDPRITKIGHFIRNTKIDELPQLINVMRGDMSLVGPRPEVARYTNLFSDDQRRVLELLPGITDPASLAYRNEQEYLATFDDPESAYITKVMPHKVEINLEYAAKANIITDFVVILKTLFTR